METITSTFAYILIVSYYCHAQTISDSLNGFSMDFLATTLSSLPENSNAIVSPYTVWTVLSVLDEGAKGNTAKELEKVLRINNKQQFRLDYNNLWRTLATRKDERVHMDISNAVFTTTAQKLVPEFSDTSQKYYGVDVQPVDFKNKNQATSTINKYIAQATGNRIPHLISAGDLDDAQIFATSALYFKGAWETPFNQSSTQKRPFYDENGVKLGDVDMMYQMKFIPYSRLDFVKATAVEIPYGDSTLMSMVVILPDKGQTVSNVVQTMTQTNFRQILDMLDKAKYDFEDEDVELYLPKFKAVSDLTLNLVLDKMGIKDLFNEQKADLLGILTHYLFVSKFVHRAEIEVNEEGTVASAASGASVSNKSPAPKFVAEKPFLYFILHKPTKSIILAGKQSSP